MSIFALKKQTLFVYVLLCNFLSGGALWAQSAQPIVVRDESEFFAIVNKTGGYITRSLHKEFWDVMNTKYEKEKRQKIVLEIQNVLDILKAFQESTWNSARTSYFSQKNEKSPDYQTLKDQLIKHNIEYFSTQVLIDNAEKIISHSATRVPLDFGVGKFYITPELIEENLTGIKGSFERLKLLLNPLWKEEYKEYILPKLNVSLLSLYPPDEYHEIITHGDEQIEITINQLCVDTNSTYEIGAVDYQKGDKKFAHFTPEERDIYIQEFIKEQFAGYKITDPLLSKGTWRGYEFSKGIASAEDYHIVMMSLFVNSKALYIKYVTKGNISLAGADFNDFTKRIQILPLT